MDLDDARLLGIEIVIKNNRRFHAVFSGVNDIFKHILHHMCTLLVTLMPI